MYKDGELISDILTVSGFSSAASIFRILKKYGVELDRGNGRGPHGPSKKRTPILASLMKKNKVELNPIHVITVGSSD